MFSKTLSVVAGITLFLCSTLAYADNPPPIKVSSSTNVIDNTLKPPPQHSFVLYSGEVWTDGNNTPVPVNVPGTCPPGTTAFPSSSVSSTDSTGGDDSTCFLRDTQTNISGDAPYFVWSKTQRSQNCSGALGITVHWTITCNTTN